MATAVASLPSDHPEPLEVTTVGGGAAKAASEGYSKVVDKPVLDQDAVPFTPDPEFDPEAVVRTDVPEVDAFYLDGILTEKECDYLVERTEKLGYSFWDPKHENPENDFRSAYTVEVMHQQLADLVWERCRRFVEKAVVNIPDDPDDPNYEVDIVGRWEPYGVLSKLLFARYLEGGHFAPHTDGTSIVDFNRRTLYTGLLYINDCAPGDGDTKFYCDAQKELELEPRGPRGQLSGRPENVVFSAQCKRGRMVVFYGSSVLHEGSWASKKYIIRTDILYKRHDELCTAPEDLEAFNLYMDAQLLAEKGHCDEAAKLFRRCFRMSPALAEVYGMM